MNRYAVVTHVETYTQPGSEMSVQIHLYQAHDGNYINSDWPKASDLTEEVRTALLAWLKEAE